MFITQKEIAEKLVIPGCSVSQALRKVKPIKKDIRVNLYDAKEALEAVQKSYYPIILFKYIECKQCHARTASVSLTLDDAVTDWNDKAKNLRLVIPYGTEDVTEVEE